MKYCYREKNKKWKAHVKDLELLLKMEVSDLAKEVTDTWYSLKNFRPLTWSPETLS